MTDATDEKDGKIDEEYPWEDRNPATAPEIECIALDLAENIEEEAGQVVAKSGDRYAYRLQRPVHQQAQDDQ